MPVWCRAWQHQNTYIYKCVGLLAVMTSENVHLPVCRLACCHDIRTRTSTSVMPGLTTSENVHLQVSVQPGLLSQHQKTYIYKCVGLLAVTTSENVHLPVCRLAQLLSRHQKTYICQCVARFAVTTSENVHLQVCRLACWQNIRTRTSTSVYAGLLSRHQKKYIYECVGWPSCCHIRKRTLQVCRLAVRTSEKVTLTEMCTGSKYWSGQSLLALCSQNIRNRNRNSFIM